MTLSALVAYPRTRRYHSKTEVYSGYFSEYALIRYRVLVEIEYLVRFAKFH